MNEGGFGLPRIKLGAGRPNPLAPAFGLYRQLNLSGGATGKIIVVEGRNN
jgi:hypothetical protein